MKRLNKPLRVALSILFWIGVWLVAAYKVGKPLLFPSPMRVLEALFALMKTRDFYLVTLHSLTNVITGIVQALLLGILLALITYKLPLIKDLVTPVMTVIKATPVASFIILAILWIGAAEVPAFITLLIVLPIVWSNLDTGLSSIDPSLNELTRVYHFSPIRRLRTLILPSVGPYFISACRSSLGLAWKAGIAAEIIVSPKNSIGTMIGEAKQYILTADMFAWTLTVVLLSLLIEWVVSYLLGSLWKRPNTTKQEETV